MKRLALLVVGAVVLFRVAPRRLQDRASDPGQLRGHARRRHLWVDDRPSVEAALGGAASFVAQMPAGVRIGVESFGREIKVLSAPTVDRALVTQQLAGLTAGGDTPLHDAVITATRSFTPAARVQGDRGAVRRW